MGLQYFTKSCIILNYRKLFLRFFTPSLSKRKEKEEEIFVSDILQQLSSAPLYLISGGIILFVAAFSGFFMVRAWRAGLAIGMDLHRL